MKFAVVIGVGRGPEALATAARTEGLLLERLGERLSSVRLAIPRLLRPAALGAVKDRPDVLVVCGGPRTARRVGQIAHRHGVPVLFLPGIRSPRWTARLWGSLSLDEMIAAIAKEEIKAARFGVGLAGEEMFFGEARCGTLAGLAQLHHAFHESESFAEGFAVLQRAASLATDLFRPHPMVHCTGRASVRMSNLEVLAQGLAANAASNFTLRRDFNCTLWKHANALDRVAATVRAAGGGSWQSGTTVDRFDCKDLTVDRPGWCILDGDPVHFEASTMQITSDTVRVCVFDSLFGVNDNMAIPYAADAEGTKTRRTAFSSRH